jgi:Raf kinase inhibitor-like YbhB/YbcL family protein
MNLHRRVTVSAVVVVLALFACNRSANEGPSTTPSANTAALAPSTNPPPATIQEVAMIEVTSTAFSSGGEIPKKHTCQGEDISPALSWQNVPAGTKTLAIIVDDPDAPDPKAPKMTWVHWVLFNIPPSVTSLAEGAKQLPEGTKEGLNDWKQTGYRGPCPPVGRHRYFHKIYALDTALDLTKPTKAALERAMEGHIVAKGELMGMYHKG